MIDATVVCPSLSVTVRRKSLSPVPKIGMSGMKGEMSNDTEVWPTTFSSVGKPSPSSGPLYSPGVTKSSSGASPTASSTSGVSTFSEIISTVKARMPAAAVISILASSLSLASYRCVMSWPTHTIAGADSDSPLTVKRYHCPACTSVYRWVNDTGVPSPDVPSTVTVSVRVSPTAK